MYNALKKLALLAVVYISPNCTSAEPVTFTMPQPQAISRNLPDILKSSLAASLLKFPETLLRALKIIMTQKIKIVPNAVLADMIIGKGSLFLGRMTNQFDGVSFVIEQNHHLASDKQAGDDKLNINAAENACCKAVSAEADSGVVMSKGGAAPLIGVAAPGTELGLEEMRLGIEKACRMGYNAILIEDSDPHKAMERMLKAGDIDGAVTMGAIVLECTDLPPYARRISEATGLPVFDFNSMISYIAISLGVLKIY